MVVGHIRFGKVPAAARDWVLTVDEPNAVLIDQVAARAALVVENAPEGWRIGPDLPAAGVPRPGVARGVPGCGDSAGVWPADLPRCTPVRAGPAHCGGLAGLGPAVPPTWGRVERPGGGITCVPAWPGVVRQRGWST